MPSPVIAVHSITLPTSGRCLSVLQHLQPASGSSSPPLALFLSAMELHSHVLCPQLHTLPRNVQLSRKASYRQDLAKLRLPYRIASKAELTALKQRGLLSMQAPSSMLIAWKDAMSLLKEKAEKAVRKRLRRWRQRKVDAPQPARKTTRGAAKQQPATRDASNSTSAELATAVAASGSDRVSAAVCSTPSDALCAVEDEDEEDEDEDEEEDGSSDDEDGAGGGRFPSSDVSVVSAQQFRIMWQQSAAVAAARAPPGLTVTLPASPCSSPPSLSSTPLSHPSTPASLPSLPHASPSSIPSPLAIGGPYRRSAFAHVPRPKTPRKCSSPFSLSYVAHDDADQQPQQQHAVFLTGTKRRRVY